MLTDINRRPMSRLIEGTLSLVSADEAVQAKSRQRAQRLLDFLGMTPEDLLGGTPAATSKSASLREVEAASKQYEAEIKKWFLEEIEDMLPVGYFDTESLEKNPWLKTFVDRLYLTLKDTAKFALKNSLADLAKEAEIEGVTSRTIFITDDQAEDQLPELLSFVKSKKGQIAERLGENIQSHLRPGAVTDPEKEYDKRRPERPFAETFFRPSVDQYIYKKYAEYLTEHQDEPRYAGFLAQAKEKGRTSLLPEDIGITIGRVDPYVVDFLGRQKKIRMQIHDRKQTQDSREKVATWQVIFSIPELAKEYPTIYQAALFQMRLPEEVSPSQFTAEEEAGDQDYLDLDVMGSAPKKGVTVRFAETFFDYSRAGSGAIKQFGFGTPEIAKRFINVLTSNFKDYLFADVFERNINKAVQAMGGEVGIRGGSKLLPDGTLEDIGEYGGGRPGVRDIKDRTQDEARTEIEQQRSGAAEKIQTVVETYGSEMIQKYLMSMEPDEAWGMKKAILSEFGPMSLVINKGQAGKAISYRELLETKEVVGEILDFIFDPDLKDVESEWGTYIRDLLTSSAATKIPGFMDAVALELYRQRVQVEIKQPTMRAERMRDTPLSEIRASISDADILGYLRSMKGSEKYTTDLKKKLQGIIRDLGKSDAPAFKHFFQRIQAWHEYLKPQLIKFLTDATLGKANTDFIQDKTLKDKLPAMLDDKSVQDFKAKKDRRKALDKELKKAIKNKDTDKEQQVKTQLESEFSTPIFDPASPQGAKFLDFLRDEFMNDKVRIKTVRTASEDMNLAVIKMAMVKMARMEECIPHA